MSKRVMILATDGFEQSELMKPKANLEKAGIETVVVSLEEGSIRGWDDKDWGESVAVDKTVDNVANCEGYDALLLPGGQINPDILRMNERAVAIVREFAMADKPIAAICHAPWLLAEADVVKVSAGQKVYFTILGEPDQRIEATLREIEPAPTSIAPSTSRTPARPGMRAMSIRVVGSFSRNFISGTRLCPPARILAPSCSSRRLTASPTEPAR